MAEPNDPPTPPADADATRYGPTPVADPAATRYSDDPLATHYSDPPTDPPIAAESAGRLAIPGYEILGELGRGGMGVVYKARQIGFERIVALKMILSGAHAGPEDLARFRAEAEAVGRLQHPNIVQVHEVGEHEGRPFFSLEFCSGGSLDRKLNGTPLLPKAAARLVETLARAVHAAHQQQVIHRDLKPANVLLTEDGTPKVTDFGLAKKLDEAGRTQTGAVIGTPSYMAPEQAGGKGKLIGPAADVYALGAILYELLTGRPPFKAASALDTVLLVLADDPIPPRQLQPKTQRDLETICLKCLQKDPRKRYVDAEALAEDLRRFQAGEPIAARPVGAAERVVKWVRRRPAVAGSLALFVLSLLTGTAVATYYAVTSNANYQDARRREKDANDQKEQVSKANVRLEAQKQQLGQTNAQLEETVARGLLRPLGTKETEMADPEFETLWELAGNKDERVHLLFVEEALQGPVTARQLRNRADLALHAAIGLDPARRRRAEDALLARLRDGQSDFDVRMDALFVVLAHEEWTRELQTAAARQAVEAMTRTKDLKELCDLAKTVGALAPRLEPAEAARLAAAAARQTMDPMGKVTERFGPHNLGQTSPWESPENAVRDALRFQVYDLAEATAALAPWLDPAEASAVARQIKDAMDKTTEPFPLNGLAKLAAALLPRLDPEEAARLRSAAVRHDVDAIWRHKPGEGGVQELSDAVALLAPGLAPAEASAVAHQAREAMGKTTSFYELHELARALAALLPRLDPAEAARLASAAARQVVDEAAKEDDSPLTLDHLAETLAALAPWFDRGEASRLALGVAQKAVKGLPAIGTGDYQTAYELGMAVAALAPRLEPAEAAVLAHQTLDAMRDSLQVMYLADVVAELAPRLDHSEAAAAASRLVDVMRKSTFYTSDLSYLEKAEAALALRLEPAEASVVAGQAVEAMDKATDAIGFRDALGLGPTTNPIGQGAIAEVLAALAPQLQPAEAHRLASAAVRQLMETMKKTTDPLARIALARAVAWLAPWLAPEEARRSATDAVRRMMETAGNLTESQALRDLAEAVAALAPHLEAGEAARQTSVVARKVMSALTRVTSTPAARDVRNQPANPFAVFLLANALRALAPWLEPVEASAVLRRSMDAMDKMEPRFVSDLANAQAALLLRAGSGSSPEQRRALASVVGAAGAPPTLLAGLPLLAEASPPLPARFTEQQLVDLLKMPTCRQEARQVIVRQLGRQCGQTFANQWKFVEWAQKNRPDLDLTSPPVRSPSP